MYMHIYGLSAIDSNLYLMFALCIWYAIKFFMCNYPTLWRCLTVLTLVLWVAVSLWITIFSRSPLPQDVFLAPFYQLWLLFHGGNPEIVRVLCMNVLLFVLGGMLLPEVLPKTWSYKRQMLGDVVCMALFSVSLELAQWHW